MTNKKTQELSQDLRINSGLSLATHIQQNPISHLEDLSKRDKSTLNVLLGIFSTTHINYIFPSLEYISKKTKSSISTVKRSLRRLCESGFISKHQRGFNLTNQYQVHPMFLNPDVRKELRFVFRCFYFIPISLLTAIPGWAQIEKDRKHYVFHKKALDQRKLSLTSYQEKRSNLNNKTLNVNVNVRTTSLSRDKDPQRGKHKPTHSSRQERVKTMEVRDYKNIERLNLTRAGEIKLTCFPPEAIEHAYGVLRTFTKKIDDPYKLLWVMAKKYCDENGIKPNQREMFRLMESEGVKITDVGVDPEKPYILKAKSETLTNVTNKRTREALDAQSYQPAPESKVVWQETIRKMKEVKVAPEHQATFNVMRDQLLSIAQECLEKAPNLSSDERSMSVKEYYSGVMEDRRKGHSRSHKPFSMD